MAVNLPRRYRFLRCFKDSIPAALAAAFGESSTASAPEVVPMAPPPPQSPQVWASSIWSGNVDGDGSAGAGSSSATQSNHHMHVPLTPGRVTVPSVPSWLTSVLGPMHRSTASPATPLLVRNVTHETKQNPLLFSVACYIVVMRMERRCW